MRLLLDFIGALLVFALPVAILYIAYGFGG
jgi:hypothetical protein